MNHIKQYITIAVVLLPTIVYGQSLSEIWNQISSNNLTIKAVQQKVTAEQINNHVGLAPENPEVEFAYLWGNPNSIGNRIDVSVTQSFDFPTAYVYRNRIAHLKDEQAQLALSKQQNDIFLEAGKLYYNIVYQNVRIHDMEHCLDVLTEISAAYQQKLNAGEINIFDYNKVKLTELNLRQEKAHAETERNAMLLELKQMNGGQAINVSITDFPEITLPAHLDDWTAHNPTLQWLSKEQQISQQQIRLDRSMWAPQLMAGYMREQIPSETFQGIKVGISVPLWHHVNTLKQTQLQSSATQLLAADERFKFEAHLQAKFANTQVLLQQIEEYRQLLSSVEAADLLNQALESGQLSLVEYLYELSVYHESHERFAEMRHDAALEFLELQVYGR